MSDDRLEDGVGMTFNAALLRHAEVRPDAVALIEGERRRSFRELLARVQAGAAALAELGVGPGERVALLGKNSIEYAEAFLAGIYAGACVVPLPTLATADTLALMLEDSRARLLLVAAESHAALWAVRERVTLPAERWLGLEAAHGGGPSWPELVRRAEPGAAGRPPVQVAGPDEFNVIYSSGTTGTPKGIVLSHDVRLLMCQVAVRLGFRPGSQNLVSTPLYSNTTLVTFLPALFCGAANVLMNKFDARASLELIERRRITHAMLVPVQYERMLRVPDLERFDLASLQVKLCTSAPLREQIKREILARLPGQLIEFYGLTEGGVSTMLWANMYPAKLGSVGTAMSGQLKIIDEQGRELPPGQTGEIVGRNGSMMTGYLNRREATEDALWRDAHGDAYVRSGDVGRLDQDGFLYLSDRKKDVIISGGFNVYATDLESVLLTHPAVLEAAVVGVPSEDWGETPLAFVVRASGSDVAAETLLQWANARLGKSQRLAGVELRDTLPRSEIGKVLKRVLREPYASNDRAV